MKNWRKIVKKKNNYLANKSHLRSVEQCASCLFVCLLTVPLSYGNAHSALSMAEFASELSASLSDDEHTRWIQQ